MPSNRWLGCLIRSTCWLPGAMTHLGVRSLVGKIARVDQNVALWQLDGAVVRVRNADEPGPAVVRLRPGPRLRRRSHDEPPIRGALSRSPGSQQRAARLLAPPRAGWNSEYGVILAGNIPGGCRRGTRMTEYEGPLVTTVVLSCFTWKLEQVASGALSNRKVSRSKVVVPSFRRRSLLAATACGVPGQLKFLRGKAHPCKERGKSLEERVPVLPEANRRMRKPNLRAGRVRREGCGSSEESVTLERPARSRCWLMPDWPG